MQRQPRTREHAVHATCEHDGCDADAIPCQLDDDRCAERVTEWLCPEHAAEAGYCASCGDFWGGIDTFEFRHPGLCDHCWEALRADAGEGDPNDLDVDEYVAEYNRECAEQEDLDDAGYGF